MSNVARIPAIHHYRGLAIHIKHRNKTNDFTYSFTHHVTLNFANHARSFDIALRDAKNHIDKLKGES